MEIILNRNFGDNNCRFIFPMGGPGRLCLMKAMCAGTTKIKYESVYCDLDDCPAKKEKRIFIYYDISLLVYRCRDCKLNCGTWAQAFLNSKGCCIMYERKWWKFWRPK